MGGVFCVFCFLLCLVVVFSYVNNFCRVFLDVFTPQIPWNFQTFFVSRRGTVHTNELQANVYPNYPQVALFGKGISPILSINKASPEENPGIFGRIFFKTRKQPLTFLQILQMLPCLCGINHVLLDICSAIHHGSWPIKWLEFAMSWCNE